MTQHELHAAQNCSTDSDGEPGTHPAASPARSLLTVNEGEDGANALQGLERPFSEVQETAVAHDPLVAAYRRGSGADLVGRLRAAQEVVAVCYGKLRHMETHPEKYDDLTESGRAISRRIRATKRLVELELRQARHASTEQVDIGSPKIRQVLDLLVQEIERVTIEMIPADTAAVVIARFRAKVAADEAIPLP